VSWQYLLIRAAQTEMDVFHFDIGAVFLRAERLRKISTHTQADRQTGLWSRFSHTYLSSVWEGEQGNKGCVWREGGLYKWVCEMGSRERICLRTCLSERRYKECMCVWCAACVCLFKWECGGAGAECMCVWEMWECGGVGQSVCVCLREVGVWRCWAECVCGRNCWVGSVFYWLMLPLQNHWLDYNLVWEEECVCVCVCVYIYISVCVWSVHLLPCICLRERPLCSVCAVCEHVPKRACPSLPGLGVSPQSRRPRSLGDLQLR
jgi:hypothetical protein